MSYSRDEPLLRIEGVSKSYGRKKVLSSVTATIADLHCSDRGRVVGQVVAFIGPSGCGKSTLLRIIAGLEKPDAGAVYLDSKASPVRAGQVGVVLQSYPMSRNRTVMGNLILAGIVGGLSAPDARFKAIQYLQQFELVGTADLYPIQLSGGMRQRVAIARQLINMDGGNLQEPQLLLLDEPFSALDLGNTRKACRMIRRIADLQDRRSIVVVTHDLRAALSVADMIWVMGTAPDGGGTILRKIDLVDREWAWREDACVLQEFCELENELAGLLSSK